MWSIENSKYTTIPVKKEVREKLRKLKKLKSAGLLETFSDVIERLMK